ncbi:MAG: nucleotidyltransferase domain-containing protein [Erysipelotrichaceae bacterium]|nr:nucleotidyltransferase domain-containing protein [Erysipelotrichaceae bacterium]
MNNKEERNSYILSLIDKDMHKKKILSLKQIKDIIKPILNKYGINDIYLFGSYARGEADQNSDIDIYCEKGKIRTLFDQNSLEEELEKALKKKVDIVFDTSVMDSYFEQQLREDLIKLC